VWFSNVTSLSSTHVAGAVTPAPSVAKPQQKQSTFNQPAQVISSLIPFAVRETQRLLTTFQKKWNKTRLVIHKLIIFRNSIGTAASSSGDLGNKLSTTWISSFCLAIGFLSQTYRWLEILLAGIQNDLSICGGVNDGAATPLGHHWRENSARIQRNEETWRRAQVIDPIIWNCVVWHQLQS